MTLHGTRELMTIPELLCLSATLPLRQIGGTPRFVLPFSQFVNLAVWGFALLTVGTRHLAAHHPKVIPKIRQKGVSPLAIAYYLRLKEIKKGKRKLTL